MIINIDKFLQRGRILKSDFEAGGLKINQCEAARFPECAASHFTYPARSGNPQDLVDGIMGREGAPQQVEIVRKPVQPDQPDTPSEPDVPDEPDTPSEPEDPSEPDDPGISDGPTKEELAKEIQEKEERLKELELEQRTAELELKQLKKKVDNAIVTSTVEGTVKSVTDEETARLENTPIISVVGEDGFYVTGRVAETAFDKIKEGMTVTVTSWTSGMTYEATISGVSSSPLTGYSDGNNENLSYYPFTAVIHGDAELSNGDGVDLSIDDLSSQDEDEIYLEQMFVREDGNQYYVYKKGDNGKLKKQYVEVGKNVSGSLEIVSGLSLDDEIAFPYGRDVREGAKTKSTDTLYDYK